MAHSEDIYLTERSFANSIDRCFMSKRNVISEIEEKNARASNKYLHGNLELYDLEASSRRIGESDATMRALHIMGIASCIEVSVREASPLMRTIRLIKPSWK